MNTNIWHTLTNAASEVNDIIDEICDDQHRADDVAKLITARDTIREMRDLIDDTIELEEII